MKNEKQFGVYIPNAITLARDKISMCIDDTSVEDNEVNNEMCFLSFPISLYILKGIDNTYLTKRYAVFESKNYLKILETEKNKTLLMIIQDFGWKYYIDKTHGFGLTFTKYLKLISALKDVRWRLVNRELAAGYVFLKKKEVLRLLSEEIKLFIEARIEDRNVNTPLYLLNISNELKERYAEVLKPRQIETHMNFDENNLPPCIKSIFDKFKTQRHLSHDERFVLVIFLAKMQVPIEKTIDMFRNFSDFNEQITRYQTEYCYGIRGPKKTLMLHSCKTLKTHGLCTSDCKITHPLQHYRRQTEQKI